jgi:cytochrome P450
MNLLHRTMSDVTVNGFPIAKGTPVVPQLSTVLFDEKVEKICQ